MWELIAANRRKSLIIFFAMGLLLLALGFVVGSAVNSRTGGIIGLAGSAVLWGILTLVAYYSGQSIFLSISGAKEVTPEVHPQLFNIVEEMKIAASMPYMPKIYIINEAAPNAFATGRDPQHSAIAVTSGLIARLNRDELQGVVAHEMSHIVNRDVMLMTFAGVMLGTIVIISEVFVRGMFYSGGGSRYRSKSDKNNQGQAVFIVIAIIFAILAPILARVLYFALSRKREYLADASAVRYTRYPEGLASALEKISNSTEELPAANKVTAPMYIVNPLKKAGMKLSDLSSTHPPISQRVKILRTIGQGANFANYQTAYASVTGKNSTIIPKSGLSETTAVPLRGASTGETKGAGFMQTKKGQRELGDIMMHVNNYLFLTCTCGMKLKIPPDYTAKEIMCPRCGLQHPVTK